MSSSDHPAQHVTLRAKGNGNYEGRVQLEMAGSWNVDLTASKDGKLSRQRLSIEVNRITRESAASEPKRRSP